MDEELLRFATAATQNHMHHICRFLCRMETVVWASVYIVCLLEVVENDFVFKLFGTFSE